MRARTVVRGFSETTAASHFLSWHQVALATARHRAGRAVRYLIPRDNFSDGRRVEDYHPSRR